MKSFKDEKAVAIHYEPSSNQVPKVIARGKGIVAENMREVAQEAEVPILRNEDLVNELIHVEIGEDIPEELYEVIAEVLVFVNDLDELERRLNHYEKKQ